LALAADSPVFVTLKVGESLWVLGCWLAVIQNA